MEAHNQVRMKGQEMEGLEWWALWIHLMPNRKERRTFKARLRSWYTRPSPIMKKFKRLIKEKWQIRAEKWLQVKLKLLIG